ncbi:MULTISPECIES: disulfide bond formation protein B [unclassified Brevundimonas]|uniref:disulfide bond formation protein B n=1 Tax=unclassified Brevundimonas TaxID=2622653 RepID=UPI0025C4BE54|nr:MULTISPECIES: disulfide bond formation protein B [unclassified Brevundimonas]
MTDAYRLLTRWWTAFALAASLAMLGAAHAFERFGGLAPCNLCLKQREVYWAAVAVGGLATAWTLFSGGRRGTPRIAAFLLAAIFATGAITAVFHMGGEYKWWALPATCSPGGGAIDMDSLAALALGTGPVVKVIGCGDVAWSWLGLSMAGWNAIISAALAVFSLLAAKRPKDARAPRIEKA